MVGVDVTVDHIAVADVPARWLRNHFAESDDPDLPLHRAGVFLFDRLRAGDRSAVLEIPVRDDQVREGTEQVTLKIQVNRKRFTRTVRVVD